MHTMKYKIPIIIFALIMAYVPFTYAQNVKGIWVTTDDKSGKKVAHVEIYERDGKLHGKVIKLLPNAKTTHCKNCTGDRKGKSLINMDIIWDLEPSDDSWNNGEILDPRSGKTYNCSIWLENKNTLSVRGSLGISSLFGKTQTWSRLDNDQTGG